MLLANRLEMAPLLADTFTETIEDSIETIIELLPTIILVVIILVAGIVVARRLSPPVERLANQLNIATRLDKTPLENVVSENQTAASLVVFVVQLYVLLFAILISAEVANATVASDWAEFLVLYVPELIGGGLIIIIGLLIGDATAKRMRTATVIQDSNYGEWIVTGAKTAVYRRYKATAPGLKPTALY
ncbi:hypothetical protein K0C01_10235 [Salinarchaeum sp. IM2453]|uniref:hypothetical protein n=1 Tax=Salinarchaeum sp. IM2453 TaxID=2862870 RepID=UPI001C835FAC|nr:hypothetical protein [Salinarchaeum sp. IM2453]QZA88162.1 hypothetical protein K0C01_10235 [Salinarchaeum sp. IM2453]